MTRADERVENGRFARDRQDADRRYNDALTALDRAIVAAGDSHEPTREDLARMHTALIVFLQQITAFVETKDREIVANVADKIDAMEQSLEAVAELRTQVSVVHRAVQALVRAPGNLPRGASVPDAKGPSAPGTAAPGPMAAGTVAPAEHVYVAFEDQFRGSDAAIAEKLRAYVPIFAGAGGDVVDLGCGRGELLAALKAAGVRARGVDMNGDMAAIARDRGLDAAQGDALAFLESAGDASLGGLVSTQLVEHLEPSYLMRLIGAAARALRPGAPIVIETINPACWLAFFSSYVRDLTHVRPIHPETLQYLLRASGFSRVELRYSAPVPDHMKMKTIDPPAAILAATDPASVMLASLAHTINGNAVILNNLMFTHLDYAAVGYRG